MIDFIRQTAYHPKNICRILYHYSPHQIWEVFSGTPFWNETYPYWDSL